MWIVWAKLRLLVLGCLALCVLAACTEEPPEGPPETDGLAILTMGDSLLAWNSVEGRSVSHAIEARLGIDVTDRSVIGARMLYALPISGSLGLRIGAQYRNGPWDWVILNGGGNDLWLGCGCGACKAKIERLISEDGREGVVPELVQKLRASGAKVIVPGYLRLPGRASPLKGCRAIGAAYEARLTAMAETDEGVIFVSNADLVPKGDLSYHDIDRIHPSFKGSAAIGARIARIIAGRQKPLDQDGYSKRDTLQ